MLSGGKEGAEGLLVVLQTFGDQLSVEPVSLFGICRQCHHIIPGRKRFGRIREDNTDIVVAHFCPETGEHHRAFVGEPLQRTVERGLFFGDAGQGVDLLLEDARQRGACLVMVTHDPNLLPLFDQTVRMEDLATA